MSRSDRPTEFQGKIRGSGPWRPLLVIGVAVVVVGSAIAARWTEDPHPAATAPPPPRASVSAAPVAVAPSPTEFVPFCAQFRACPKPAPTPPAVLGTWPAPAGTADLNATGVFVADAADPAVGALVPDVDGGIWTTQGEALVHLDPETGRVQTWSLANDPLLATGSIARSEWGGVWIIDETTIRLFDGERFFLTIATPSRVRDVAAGPDGTLWAATERHGLARWKSGVWSAPPPGRHEAGVASLLVDRTGRVWTSDIEPSKLGGDRFLGISMWDGQRWSHFAPEELRFDPLTPPALLEGEDDSIWATRRFRHARFTGDGWEPVQPTVTGLAGVSLQAVDVLGRLWFLTASCGDCDATVRVYFGSTWTSFPDELGVPGPGPGLRVESAGPPGFGSAAGGWDGRGGGSIVLVRGDLILASTASGLARLFDRGWHHVPLRSFDERPAVAGAITAMAAVSKSDVWVATVSDADASGLSPQGSRSPGAGVETALHRFNGVEWLREALPGDAPVRQLVAASDGALWAATDAGPMVHRGATWTDLTEIVARAVARDPTTDPSCVGPSLFLHEPQVEEVDVIAYYVGPGSGQRVVKISPTGDSWAATPVTAPIVAPCGQGTLAASHIGLHSSEDAIWFLTPLGELLHWHIGGTRWDATTPPSPGPTCPRSELTAIGVDHDSAFWAAGAVCTPFDVLNGVFRLERASWLWTDEVEPLGRIAGLAVRPNGSMLAVGDGVALYDTPIWTHWLRGVPLDRVSVGLDGSVWVAGANVYRLPQPIEDLPQ